MKFYRIRLQIEKNSCEVQHLLHHSICSLCRGLQIHPITSIQLDSPNDYVFQESFGRYVWARMFFEPLTQTALQNLVQEELPRVQQALIKHFAGRPIIKAFIFFPSLAKGMDEVFHEFSSDWLFIEYGFFNTPKEEDHSGKHSRHGLCYSQLDMARFKYVPPVGQSYDKLNDPMRLSRDELLELLEISFALNHGA